MPMIWIPLRGLDYPVNDTDAAQSDAVALFAARRAQGRQDKMSPDELVVVRQICRLVEGLPRG